MVMARVGVLFHEAVEVIKDNKLRNGTAKDRPSSEKITNLITKHKLWRLIVEELEKVPEEILNRHGKK